MRTYPWLLLPIVVAVAIPWAACGGSNPVTGAGGHATTTKSTTHSTTTSMGGSATTLAACDAPATAPSKGTCYTIPVHTPPPSCKASATDGGTGDAGSGDAGAGGGGTGDAGTSDAGVFSCSTAIPMANACGMCIESSCCAALTACNAIPNCIACATDPNVDPTTCMDTALMNALNDISTCQGTCCQDICSPGCNPVTNAGCDPTNMEACDIDLNNPGAYTCFQTPMGSDICQMCDEMMGPFCNPGLTCLSDGNCGAYCCTDADCGSGKCDKTQLPMETVLGVCVNK